MLLRILGTAAGGGLPQWNCACPGGAGARRHPTRRRLHDGLAVHGADPGAWFLANATPDVAEQLEDHSALRPGAGQERTPVVPVVLTDAELDHTLGLLRLREAARIDVWCTEPVHKALTTRLPLPDILAPYTELTWHELPLTDAGQPARIAGLEVSALPLSDKRPRYAADEPAHPAWSAALEVRDPGTGASALYAPAVASWSDLLDHEIASADCVLLDGTFLHEDEPRRTGVSRRTASEMGHMPIEGRNGTAERLRRIGARVHYTHLNNTNPLVDPDAPQHERLAGLGLRVAEERMVVSL
ncbi:pyrroloquinoline quinone biosynthesis protein PqqB [Streptomyces sp. CL12-4]|uniref:pyrroloquinoline quinone biosynthesis protein PqqB n=1 Tax=Streptomyces sp. CL12-4 TaxID=2810306 RepID=UPI001EFABC5F|nr:MBL fold metallo-hydrolase [Streptomyces sp. CL12-4]MCG8971628.1 pyrroloquinoline quinone biosynthesis protein PqqB [Streptomyces sp. CL12-4]